MDNGPFYHGTRADLRIGDLLSPGYRSNYRPEIVMNHIYFTASGPDGAGLAAALAKGSGRERVYIVEPTGDITFVQVKLGSAVIIVSVDPSVKVAPDEPVWIEFDQSKLHLFDGATQNAL